MIYDQNLVSRRFLTTLQFSCSGGINTWLLAPYGPGRMSPVTPATSRRYPGDVSHTVSVAGAPLATDQLAPLLAMSGLAISLDTTALSVGCSQVWC